MTGAQRLLGRQTHPRMSVELIRIRAPREQHTGRVVHARRQRGGSIAHAVGVSPIASHPPMIIGERGIDSPEPAQVAGHFKQLDLGVREQWRIDRTGMVFGPKVPARDRADLSTDKPVVVLLCVEVIQRVVDRQRVRREPHKTDQKTGIPLKDVLAERRVAKRFKARSGVGAPNPVKCDGPCTPVQLDPLRRAFEDRLRQRSDLRLPQRFGPMTEIDTGYVGLGNAFGLHIVRLENRWPLHFLQLPGRRPVVSRPRLVPCLVVFLVFGHSDCPERRIERGARAPWTGLPLVVWFIRTSSLARR